MKKVFLFLALLVLSLSTVYGANIKTETETKDLLQILDEKKVFQDEVDNKIFNKIKNLNNEQARRKVFDLVYKNEDNFIKEKSAEIFGKMDNLMLSLENIKKGISLKIENLETQEIALDSIDLKFNDIERGFDKAKTEKAIAWIKLNKLDLNKTKEELFLEINEIQKHLLASKSALKDVSLEMKEFVYFLKGVIINLK